ncbi:MAG TPA: universal stress protein, partial [Solirubrobacteraceae bacterium]|nr:universal stress protein [Solirubrobacteraceae bacterium]
MSRVLTAVSLSGDAQQHRRSAASRLVMTRATEESSPRQHETPPCGRAPGHAHASRAEERRPFAAKRPALPRSPICRCCRAWSESFASPQAQPSAQSPIRHRHTYPPTRPASVGTARKCTPVPMVVRRNPGHGGPMTVLAAFDPQTLDRAPVRFAAAAARLAHVPLVIASVRASVAPAPSAQEDVIGEELERLRTAITCDHGIEVRTRTVKALPPVGVTRGLQSVIDEEHASLVVVGSSKRGVVGQVVPGTTAQRVISGCGCPVVVVPRGYDPPKQLTTIGVAFVPTPEGRRALHEAATIAQMSDADLRVLTVVKPGIGGDASAGPARVAAARNRAQLEATLTAAIAELADGVRAESEVLVDDPARALASVSPHLDLLVMGSRGHRPGLAVLLGGVSRRVTMKARCPVLVVPRRSTSSLAPSTHRTMTTVCKTYASEAIAGDAVDALTAAGVPRR